MNKVINNVKKNFLLYLAWGIVSISMIIYEFSILSETKENEKVDILINACEIDETAFIDIINKNKASYLKEVNYRFNNSNNGMLANIVNTYGKLEADLIILSKKDMEKVDANSYFYRLDESSTNSIFNKELTYYYDDHNLPYGIEIYCDFIKDEDDTFYLFFNNNSMHLGSLTNSDYDGAIILAEAFIGEYYEKESK